MTNNQIDSDYFEWMCDKVYDADEDEFVFTVYGYGHGVGMSQFGAGYMAGHFKHQRLAEKQPEKMVQ